ncbi:MAG: hypothetical protein GY870_12290 [archaeon]|nr:hypothetical protein [archaeon]
MRRFSISEEDESNPELEKVVKIILISGILILLPFIFYTSTRNDNPHMIISVLNENKELGNYPHNAATGTNISLYFLVENHGYGEIDVKIKHLKGNDTVFVNSSGSYNTSLVGEYEKTMIESERWISDIPINTSLSDACDDSRILFELWINEDPELGYEYYDIAYIWVDII